MALLTRMILTNGTDQQLWIDYLKGSIKNVHALRESLSKQVEPVENYGNIYLAKRPRQRFTKTEAFSDYLYLLEMINSIFLSRISGSPQNQKVWEDAILRYWRASRVILGHVIFTFELYFVKQENSEQWIIDTQIDKQNHVLMEYWNFQRGIVARAVPDEHKIFAKITLRNVQFLLQKGAIDA